MKNFILFLLTLSAFSPLFGQLQIPFSPASNGQTFNTCSGFIIDSGGQGGTGYSNNENTTITVCPDVAGDFISVVFNLFNLSNQDDNPAPNATNVDYMTVYDGNSTAANTLGTYSGNQLQGVVIQATVQNTSGCLTFVFTSNTIGTGSFTGSATCETPCSNPIAGGIIVDGIAPDSIQVCVGDEVFFQQQGSFAQPGFNLVAYEWDFMDGSTASGQSVSHVFNVPGQYRVQLFVTDNNGCSNPNLVDLEVLVGTIPSFIGFPENSEICIGESVQLVANPDAYEVIWNGFPGNQTVDDGCLTDNQLGVAQNIELLQTGFAAGSTIQNVNDIQDICLEMEHSFVGDLVVILNCPNGQSVVMHQQGGGGVNLGTPIQADNVNCDDPATQGIPFQYCFTPSATNTWVEAIAAGQAVGNSLPAGNYESVQALSNLVGCPTNGIWTLSVIDNWAADDGVLFSFGLNLDPSYYPDITSFEPQIGLGADSSFWDITSGFITNQTADGNSITVEPTSAGSFNYTYYVTDNFGCEYDSTVTILVNDNAEIFAGNDTTICFGNTINLEAELANSSGGCNYNLVLEDTFGDSWNGNTITVSINGAPTTYTVATGDLAQFPLVIPNGANIQLTFNANGNWINECQFALVNDQGTTVLQGGPGLSAPMTLNTVSNCQPDYVFEWTAATNLSDANSINPVWTPQLGVETLTLRAYPVGHPLCVSEAQVTATVIELPNTGDNGTVDFCSADPAVDLFNYLQNNPETGGTWTDENDLEITMPFDPSTLATGTYVFTYTLGADACSDASTVTVSIIVTEITNSLVSDVTCNSGSDGQIAIDGINIDSYQLNGGAPVAVSSPFIISNLSAGNYSLEVFSTGGCADILNFEIDQPTPLSITSISNDTIICFGGDATLSANGTGGSSAYTYTWSLNGAVVGTGSTITLTPPIGVSNYCVELSEACGSPVAIQCMNVTTEEPIIPSLLVDTIAGCSPHQVDFTNASNGSILTTFVDFGDGTNQVVNGNEPFEHTFVVPGQYSMDVVITSTIGCVYSASFEEIVEVYPNPVALFNVSPNPVTIFDPVVLLQDYSVGDIVDWQWYIEGGTPAQSSMENVVVQFPEMIPSVYDATLYVTTQYGCIDSLTKQVQVVNDVTLYAPTAFTPDGDEYNQYWNVYIEGIDASSFNLQIYNRWGERIWESNDFTVGWDGTYNGRVVQSGTYTWIIECRDAYTDKKYTFNGNLNLLK